MSIVNRDIQAALPKVREYLSSQPVVKAWLFGSYSRGEEKNDSDIDVLVEYDRENSHISLMTISRLALGLEDILHKEVDLVDDKGLLPFARQSADSDKVLIYERRD